MDDRFYSHHLATMNDVNGVVATEDIKNAQGQLLVPAGHAINHAALDKIIKFKLLKPLEGSVALEQQLNHESLYAAIEHLFISDDSKRDAWQTFNNKELLTDCCKRACGFPILLQKITVLANQLPNLHEKALFSAWFAMSIYAKNGEPTTLIHEAFIAGLIHDIGKLHLNPDYFTENRELEPHEWRQLQAHPLISYQVAKNVPGLSDTICNAVMDHHESIDGTGYPANKLEKNIHPLAQILHLIDSTYAIYSKHFKPRMKSLSDLIPIIQVNQHYRYNRNASALMVLLKSIPTSKQAFTPLDKLDQLINYVKDKNNFIIDFLDKTSVLNTRVGYTHHNKKIISLQNILLHIHITMARSGLLDNAYINWLSQENAQGIQDNCREIEDTSLMLTEIIHHCKNFKLHLNLLIQEGAEEKFLPVLTDIHNHIDTLHPPPVEQFSELLAGMSNSAIQ